MHMAQCGTMAPHIRHDRAEGSEDCTSLTSPSPVATTHNRPKRLSRGTRVCVLFPHRRVPTLCAASFARPARDAGGSAPPEARGARWDEGELNQLRSELEKVLEGLERLPTPRTLLEQEQALTSEINALTSKTKYAEADAKVRARPSCLVTRAASYGSSYGAGVWTAAWRR